MELQQANDVDNVQQRRAVRPHLIILHEKLIKRKTDRYIINLGMAYNKIGYKVTLITTQYDKHNYVSDIEFADIVTIEFSGWWIPRSILGFFRTKMSAIKAAWMAFRLLFFPPEPKPDLIILDVSMCALYILNLFTNYKLFYLETFLELKNRGACYEHSRIFPTLLEAKWIKLADEIIVENNGFAEIWKKSFPSIKKEPIILYPAVDIGLWREPGIKIQRIIPDLLDNTILFLSIGKFRRSSNFRLALDAFELLLELIHDKTVTKRFHLVIAGNCMSLEEKFYYNEMVAAAKERICASQVTFLKQLPVIHEKTLIMESDITIHPAKNSVCSDFLLKAMSLGKLIVAANKGIASKLLVHRLSGVIIEPTPRMFAVAMKKLMTYPYLQVFLGSMARETFEKNYSYESLCNKVSKIMKKVSNMTDSLTSAAASVAIKKNY